MLQRDQQSEVHARYLDVSLQLCVRAGKPLGRQPSTRRLISAAASSHRLPLHSQPALNAALTFLYPGRRLHEHQASAVTLSRSHAAIFAVVCVNATT